MAAQSVEPMREVAAPSMERMTEVTASSMEPMTEVAAQSREPMTGHLTRKILQIVTLKTSGSVTQLWIKEPMAQALLRRIQPKQARRKKRKDICVQTVKGGLHISRGLFCVAKMLTVNSAINVMFVRL